MADYSNIPKIIIPYPNSVINDAKFAAGMAISRANGLDKNKLAYGKTEYTDASSLDYSRDDALETQKGSPLGNPIYSNLDINGGEYQDANGKTISYPALEINTVLFTINQSKNIVKTSINGLSGTIKEYIADGDFIINISGIITGKNGAYPYLDVKDLKNVLAAPVPLEINSGLLNELGIYTIVVENYHLPQEVGGQSQQRFEINALSDIAYEIFENI